MPAHPLASSGPAPVTLRLLIAASAAILLAVACGRSRPDLPVLDHTDDTQVVFATTNCTIKNSDGKRCNEKTCKTDEESNCEYFASRCLATGHSYSGTKDAGTCTRAHDNDKPA
jgi:hypothetical protein